MTKKGSFASSLSLAGFAHHHHPQQQQQRATFQQVTLPERCHQLYEPQVVWRHNSRYSTTRVSHGCAAAWPSTRKKLQRQSCTCLHMMLDQFSMTTTALDCVTGGSGLLDRASANGAFIFSGSTTALATTAFSEPPVVDSSMLSSPTTTITPTTTFEPVLNVPAFGVFVFIAVIFGFLQYRMAAIGSAADRRTEALANLRKLKAWQLSSGDGGGNSRRSSSNDSASRNDKETNSNNESLETRVQRATEEYREALLEVERLRTVIPGLVRIPPPPAESASRERMEENVSAAKQFLNITLPPVEPVQDDVGREQSKVSGSNNKKKNNKRSDEIGLQPWGVAILIVTLVAQLSLWWLFTVGSDTLGASSPLFSGP